MTARKIFLRPFDFAVTLLTLFPAFATGHTNWNETVPTNGVVVNQGLMYRMQCGWGKFHQHKLILLNKSTQVSPNARRRAQCKGGGGKGKYRYTRNCTTYRRLSENVVATVTWNRNPGNKHVFSRLRLKLLHARVFPT